MTLVVKNLPAPGGDTGDMDLIPGQGRSPEGVNGNPLQYSCLESPIMDRGGWWARVHGVAGGWTGLKQPCIACNLCHVLEVRNPFFQGFQSWANQNFKPRSGEWEEEGERDILNLRLESMRALMSVDLHLCLSQCVSLFLDNIAEMNLQMSSNLIVC